MKSIKSFAVLVLSLLSFTSESNAQNKSTKIEISVVQDEKRLELPDVQYDQLNVPGADRESVTPTNVNGNTLTYGFLTKGPLMVIIKNVGYFLAEPGDKVSLHTKNGYLIVKGAGRAKYQLMDSIRKVKDAIKKPANMSKMVNKSETDYLAWHDYISAQLEKAVPLIDSYKNKLSPLAYEYIRSQTIDRILDDYSDRFVRWTYMSLGITRERALELYDTRYKPLTDKYFPYVAEHWGGTWKPVLWGVDRKYDFVYTAGDFNTDLKRNLVYLEAGKKVFKGRAREKFVYEVLFKKLVKAHGFLPELEAALDDYYAEKGYPEWKAYIRNKVQDLRSRLNAKSAPDFELINSKGKVFTKADFIGKFVIFDYWFTGCAGCVQMAPAMRKLEEEFSKDSNVVFVNVSIDKSKEVWLNSIKQAKYTSGEGINLYTGGHGMNHSMIKYYGISGYPALVFMNTYGKAINVSPKIDPRSANGYQRMRDFIRKQLVEMNDGPYLIDENNQAKTYSLNGTQLKVDRKERAYFREIKVGTYKVGETFTVQLKDKLVNEHAVAARPEKLLVLSDIEGNFEAFAKLLQANKIIDQSYNWTFGNGHLVFAGDMFDRGEQVTECLWLMYALEEKAKSAGGYVHFILGNHEIMNLQGDDRYNQPKYIAMAKQSAKKLSQLYGEDSELGRWLRTKNIMEKVGELLFVHGGVGLEFADVVKLPIDSINNLARPNYANTENSKSADKNLTMIFDQLRGPLWYRLYYENGDGHYYNISDTSQKFTVKHPSQQELESILAKYEAKRIITGHTIVADTISVLYDNRVINTDVPHAKGKSEALLIEGNAFYRVNDKGERKLLFRDEEENLKTKK